MIESPIKIVQVLLDANVGGREKIVLELIKGLNKEKFNVYSCFLKGKGSLYEYFKQESLNIKTFNLRSGIDLNLIRQLRDYFKDIKADIVHIHNPGTLNYGVVSALLCKVPVIINTEHGFAKKGRLRKRIAYNIFRNLVDMNICVSNNLKRQINKYIIRKNRIIVLYNGVNVRSYQSETAQKVIEKYKVLGFSSSDMIVGNVARLEAVKNHVMLLRALKSVIVKHHNVKMLIVGDGTLRKVLENISQNLGVAKNVIFWGETDNVFEVSKIFDVFALSSKNEGISLTILEAMAQGIPVVATDVGGNREIVIHNETGFLVPLNDVETFSQSIIDLLIHKEKAREMGMRGQNRVNKLFNLHTMVGQIEDLYFTLFTNKNRR
ncbi:MAG: glycosyltransferase [Candidatus Thorarchaeota archaeon]